MLNSVKISIIANHCTVDKVSFVAKDGKEQTLFKQEAYVELGQVYPVKIMVPIESPMHAYVPADYLLNLESFRVSSFGALEINPYNTTLVKIEDK